MGQFLCRCVCCGNAGCELLFNRLVRRDEWNLRHHAVVLKPIVPWNPDVVGSLGFNFEEGEVVDPPLEVHRSKSTTNSLAGPRAPASAAKSAKIQTLFALRVPRYLSFSSCSTNMSPASSGNEQTPSSTYSLSVTYHGAAESSSQLLDTSHTALEDMELQSTSFNDAKVQLNVIKIRMLEVRNLDLQSNG